MERQVGDVRIKNTGQKIKDEYKLNQNYSLA
jgi:hypothetical protein